MDRSIIELARERARIAGSTPSSPAAKECRSFPASGAERTRAQTNADYLPGRLQRGLATDGESNLYWACGLLFVTRTPRCGLYGGRSVNGFNFSCLNREQSGLLDAAGWTAGCARPAPTRRAVRELVERGLIEAYPAMHEDDHGPYKVVEYYVPQEVQRAWQALNASKGQEIDPGDQEEGQL